MGLIEPRAILLLEGLSQLKILNTLSEIEPDDFQPAAECPNPLRNRVPHLLTFSGRSTHICAMEGNVEVAKVHIFVQPEFKCQ
jgi:hypothetical protein